MGQPELRDLVRQPDLMQFAQRVTASFHLSAMDEETVDAYIQHRLDMAGATYRIVSEEACRMIARSARGIPRLVNQLADYSLVYAASDNQAEVTEQTVRNVLKDGVFFTDALLLTDAKT
jgi:type II secretory pathway predicted ATPase ExeA